MSVISQYQVVIPGQSITAALWNGMELNIINNGLIPGGIEDYSATDGQMQTMTDPYPASSISRPTSLAGEVERIRWQLDNIIGGTNWYEDPAVDISTMKTRFDAHTHDGTANNGPQIAAAGLASNSVTEAKISTSVAGDGLAGGGGSALSVNVDNSTIEISSDSLRLKDGGITGAKLSSNYVMTSRPAFHAYCGSNYLNVTGNSVTYKVQFESELFDQGSNYNTGTYTFTAPTTGIYILSYSIFLSTGSTRTGARSILVTTSRSYENDFVYTSNTLLDLTLSQCILAKMTSGDTAYVNVFVVGGTQTVTVGSNRTQFSGALLF